MLDFDKAKELVDISGWLDESIRLLPAAEQAQAAVHRDSLYRIAELLAGERMVEMYGTPELA